MCGFLKLSIFFALTIFSQYWSSSSPSSSTSSIPEVVLDKEPKQTEVQKKELLKSSQAQLQNDLYTLAEKINGGYGYKTANLAKIKEACDIFNKNHPYNQYTLIVPEFTGIPSDFMVELINNTAGINLSQSYNANPKDFVIKLKEILLEIDGNAAVSFIDKKMNGALSAFLKECDTQHNKIMVRSTGREDTTKMANAGGNETIANVDPKNQAVWSAMVQVLLSYFSDKSIAQQNLGKTVSQEDQKESTALYLPVLLQVMVGETDSGVPTSGVLFSEDPETHVEGKFSGIAVLDFTYGHCEAVVNSLLPCDQLRIDDFDVVYPHFVKKSNRLVPDPSTGEKLISVANDEAKIIQPSLDKTAALILKRFGSYLERSFYGYSVDIEFVVLGKQIHIVQNRPITYDTKKFERSYIDLKVLGPLDAEKSTKGKVIGTGHKEVRVINKTNIIAEKNLLDALKIFLKMSEQKTDKDIQYILVEEMAAPTSHAATVFRGVSLPVICIKNIEQIKNLAINQKILVSPQQGIVIWNQDRINTDDIFKCIKPGFAGYPINEITADGSWLGLHKISVAELARSKIQEGKNIKYHDNRELAALQGNLLACFKYYSIGIDGLDKGDPQYLLRQKALDLLVVQGAMLKKKIINPENQLNKTFPNMKDERSIQYMKLAEYAQNREVKDAWIGFIKNLDNLDKETQNRFSLMCGILAKYKVLPVWLNSFFYNIATDTSCNHDSKIICEKLLKEFKDNDSHLADVAELLQEVQNWDKESFADPKTFEQKLPLFSAMLGKFSHAKLYKIFKENSQIDSDVDQQPYLAQLIWLKCLDELVDCVDLSIKSLTGSTIYIKGDKSDAETSQETQVARFKRLLQENYSLLKTILCLKNREQTEYAFIDNKIHGQCTRSLIERINWGFEHWDMHKNANLSQMMNPSPKFNAIEQILGNIQTNDGLWRISPTKTGDDIFTTIHQNELSTLSRLNYLLLKKNKVQSNEYASTFMRKIAKIEGGRFFSQPQLKSLEFRGKKIILNYNVPLLNHSSTIEFECNTDGAQGQMIINIFGANSNDRWEHIRNLVDEEYNGNILSLSQNDSGVSTTLEILKNDLTDDGLEKYFSIFKECVHIANGGERSSILKRFTGLFNKGQRSRAFTTWIENCYSLETITDSMKVFRNLFAKDQGISEALKAAQAAINSSKEYEQRAAAYLFGALIEKDINITQTAQLATELMQSLNPNEQRAALFLFIGLVKKGIRVTEASIAAKAGIESSSKSVKSAALFLFIELVKRGICVNEALGAAQIGIKSSDPNLQIAALSVF